MSLVKAEELLKKCWGYDSFRNPQDQIIEGIVEGKDTIALLPTGGGKSLCFQIPALMIEGMCLVISPLIALMDDQVQNLKKRKIRAEALHSGISIQNQNLIKENAHAGYVKLLYVSPEKLQSESFRTWLKSIKVGMIAIDEAHCVSEWGHDFRPSYLRIPEIYALVNEPLVCAFTATATQKVLEDLQSKLGLSNPEIIKSSFKRSNLSYHIAHSNQKFIRLTKMLNGSEGSVIVYMRSRRGCVHIADKLRKEGFTAEAYHAGLSFEKRNSNQLNWIQNRIRIMVATSAFGMGIDKADVRLVIHYEMPESLEAYIQEAGRAGRDELHSYAIMLRSSEDRERLNKKKEGLLPPFDRIKQIYDALVTQFHLPIGQGAGKSFDIDLNAFADHFSFERREINFSLDFLEREGYMEDCTEMERWSKLRFELSGERLYHFQVVNDRYGPLIRYLLRAYEGITFEYKEIHETKISRILKIPQKNIRKQLNALQKEGILRFLPSPEHHRIRMLVDRQDSRYFAELKEKHSKLLKRRREKYEDSMRFLFDDTQCREKQLLSYFGETDVEKCGKCDVCAKGQALPSIDHIRELVAGKPLSLEEISVLLSVDMNRLGKQIADWEKDELLRVDAKGRIGLN